MNQPRCRVTVHWHGYDLTTRCQRPEHHDGNHHDGLWAFDQLGLRVDGSTNTRELVTT